VEQLLARLQVAVLISENPLPGMYSQSSSRKPSWRKTVRSWLSPPSSDQPTVIFPFP
jgi:hypothetical protein